MDFLTKTGTHNNPVLKVIVAVLFIVLPIVGFVFGMQYGSLLNQNNLTDNKTILSSPIKNSNNSDANSSNKITWVKTNSAGRGVTFEYPRGWHVAIDNNVRNMPLSYSNVFVSSVPIIVSTTEGSISDFVISVQNGLPNPQKEFEKLLNNEKKQLTDLKEDILSSKYFEKIYKITGKVAGEGFRGGSSVEKYFIIQTNPKYFPHDPDGSNINIITIDGGGIQQERLIFNHILMSIKECHFTWCENE